jgi:hypothetical protein
MWEKLLPSSVHKFTSFDKAKQGNKKNVKLAVEAGFKEAKRKKRSSLKKF